MNLRKHVFRKSIRKEQEILTLILDFAKNHQAIRVVTLEGSRANPNIKKDIFCDYDISFFLDKQTLQTFKDNKDDSWLQNFGKSLMLQKPESMELYPPDLKEGWFSYLCLFDDGVRLDLMLIPLDDVEFYKTNEPLMQVLLDKDKRFADALPASDCAFHIKPLTKQSFLDCCNEFYWLYVCCVKDLLRGEILLLNAHLSMMREGLLIMLSWYVGLAQNNFAFSLGKEYKFLPEFLTPKQTQKLYECYQLGNKKQAKQTLKNCEKFFVKIAEKIMYSCFQDFQTIPYQTEAKTYAKILKELK
ncbi:aminoglycoside 6-adenylyltransferase [Helicobacter sp. MIT 05-5293]|uniref:aminoglycoside 6-adenylyltransferase n=1 Tax=Helicobacter sp. MIT 05-5293 TaxID=1548149 RepID=UPI00068B2A58|nr:aminoglycoside 6-adenylyltransferase [Helicobacter sp. MIT 05-5293]TLD80888.1 aminoglycoside 6-adenylyltransferase [Helicobacter sp. MIT 05-5293]